jgi:hypothetical protein
MAKRKRRGRGKASVKSPAPVKVKTADVVVVAAPTAPAPPVDLGPHCQAWELTTDEYRLEPWICERPVFIAQHRLCEAHYKRLVKFGNVGGPIRKRRKLSIPPRVEVPA